MEKEERKRYAEYLRLDVFRFILAILVGWKFLRDNSHLFSSLFNTPVSPSLLPFSHKCTMATYNSFGLSCG